MIQYMLYSIY